VALFSILDKLRMQLSETFMAVVLETFRERIKERERWRERGMDDESWRGGGGGGR